MLASALSGITDAVTSAVGDYGLYAVFLLMLLDAVFPAASEVVMVFGGALASGAIAGSDVVLFGWEIDSGGHAFVAIALAGTVGYTIGSIGGWAVGRYGGRPYVERHQRLLHMSEAKLAKADRWFERYGDAFVALGRVTPVLRSFVAIPAGLGEMPLGRYVLLTIPGSAAWCFGLAGAGWALGSHWERFHDAFRYADYAIVAGILLLAAYLALKFARRRRRSQLSRGQESRSDEAAVRRSLDA